MPAAASACCLPCKTARRLVDAHVKTQQSRQGEAWAQSWDAALSSMEAQLKTITLCTEVSSRTEQRLKGFGSRVQQAQQKAGNMETKVQTLRKCGKGRCRASCTLRLRVLTYDSKKWWVVIVNDQQGFSPRTEGDHCVSQSGLARGKQLVSF